MHMQMPRALYATCILKIWMGDIRERNYLKDENCLALVTRILWTARSILVLLVSPFLP